MQQLLTLVLEQVRNILRFRWIALLLAWIIAVCGWLFVYSLPNQYESEARVHIDTKSAIKPLLSGMAVMPNVNQQVDLLIQTVLSRPNLADIARRTGLDLSADSDEQEQALLDALKQRISLKSVGYKTDLYRVSYTSNSGKTAQAVVQQVINIMNRMTLQDRGGDDDSVQAAAFLQKEVDKYKQHLNDTEKQLATFKKNHAELMPGANDYVTQLQQLTASIGDMQDRLSALQTEKASLQSQGHGGGGGVSAEGSQQIAQLDQQISDSENKLRVLLGKYTQEHPDVIAQQHEIARLKAQRIQTLADLRAHPSQIRSIGLAGDSGSGIAQQIGSVNIQINTLQASIARKQSQIAALRAGADNMTDTQSQLAEMTRNYQVTQDQYQKLLTRLYSARLTTDVQNSSDPLEFRVIDPPENPVKPSGPNRVILMAMALIGGLTAGLAFAFFLSQIRPVFINRRALTDATGLPVLGSVSMAWTPRQRAQRQSRLMMFVAGVVALVVVFLGAVAFAPIGVELIPSFITGQPL